MRVLRIDEEICDAIVARPRDQAVALPKKEIDGHANLMAGVLQPDRRKEVIDKDCAAETRRRHQRPQFS
jgi:hypothetical protein